VKKRDWSDRKTQGEVASGGTQKVRDVSTKTNRDLATQRTLRVRALTTMETNCSH
jgi:hypothetical protein